MGIDTEPYRNLPLGQMDMADDPAVHLGQQPLIGSIRRVAECTQERLAVRTVEDVEQRLIDRFMIGFGAEAILDRAAAKWKAISRRGGFHRVDHRGDAPRAAAIRRSPGEFDACHHTPFCLHCTGSRAWYAAKRRPPSRFLYEMANQARRSIRAGNSAAAGLTAIARNGRRIGREVRSENASGPVSGPAPPTCSMLCSQPLRGMEHERKLAVPRDPVRTAGAAAPPSADSRSSSSTFAHPGCNASLHRRIARHLAFRSRRVATDAAIASRLALIKLRTSSEYGSDKWRSGLNRRSRKRRSTPASSSRRRRIDGQAEPERQRNGQEAGGSIPKKRRAISSPSSSYLAPPIPWMKRSPSKKRLKSVVVKARVRSRIDRAAQLAEPLDGATGLAIRARGSSSKTSSSPAIRRSITRERCRTRSAAAPRLSRPPDPERRLEPLALPRQRGDRMVLAPDSDEPRDTRPGRRCGPAGIGEAGPAGATTNQKKPSVWQTSLSGTSRLETPHDASSSRRASENRMPVRGGLAPAREHARPEVVEQRVRRPHRPETCAHPVGERRKPLFVQDRRVFKGCIAAPAIELDPREPNAAARRSSGTAIDDDLGMSLSTIRLRPTPPLAAAIDAGGEVLDPDAGMEQLGLMPGHDQRADPNRSRRRASSRLTDQAVPLEETAAPAATTS